MVYWLWYFDYGVLEEFYDYENDFDVLYNFIDDFFYVEVIV